MLIVLTVASIMAASYGSIVLSATARKVTFSVDPLVIDITTPAMSASATDSVSCSPDAGTVQLLAKNSNPTNLLLSVSPDSFSCGSTPTSFVVTATCLVPADQCKGSYNGQIQIRQPSNYYRNLANALRVAITVS